MTEVTGKEGATRMWASHRGGTAEEPPTPEQIEQWRRRTSPPDNEFPAGTGLTTLLGRTDDAAVGITDVAAYSTGFQFRLAVRLRQVPPELAYGGLFTLISSHVPPGVEIPVDNRLLLGIEYPDGRRASTLNDARMPGTSTVADDGQLVLFQQGGGGGERSVDQTYWVAPLPPDGPVAFIMAWPSFGMPERRTVLDGTAIRAAAARSLTLWPPQRLGTPPVPPPAPRPSTGWFAEPLG